LKSIALKCLDRNLVKSYISKESIDKGISVIPSLFKKSYEIDSTRQDIEQKYNTCTRTFQR